MAPCDELPGAARDPADTSIVGRWTWRAVLTVFLLLWAGCSIERDYAVLSFFFDGVPEPLTPEEQEEAASGVGNFPRRDAIVSSHQAYLDRQCAVCHGDRATFGFTTTGFSDLGDDICARCHREVLEGLIYVHGPIAEGGCLPCHEPHASVHPKLLTDASPALCLACHDAEIETLMKAPAHQDLDRDCLDCHFAHGADDRLMLRATWADAMGPEQ